MKALNVLVVLVTALVLAACGEYPTDPAPNERDEATYSTTRETAYNRNAPIPGAPSNIVAAVRNNLVTVSWKRNVPYTESGFVVFQASKSVYWNPIAGEASAGDTSFTLPVPIGKSEWQYDVAAYVMKDGKRLFSTSTGPTNWVSVDVNVPGTPTKVTGAPLSNGTVLLTWDRESPFTENYFLVYDHRGNMVARVLQGATSCVVGGLERGQAYRFMIMAKMVVNGTEYGAPQSLFTEWISVAP